MNRYNKPEEIQDEVDDTDGQTFDNGDAQVIDDDENNE